MVFVRRAIISATNSLSDRTRAIAHQRSKMATAGRRESAAVRLCCLPAAFYFGGSKAISAKHGALTESRPEGHRTHEDNRMQD